MIVDVGGAVSGAEREAAGPARGGPGHGTRRRMLRGLLAPALAVTLTPLIAASRPFPPSDATECAEGTGSTGGTKPAPAGAGARPEPHAAEPSASAEFDETYRGRRIRGTRSTTGHAVGAGTWHVTVDGRPLHLMRRADGGWLSMIDHYRSYPTPLAAARGAVDELGPGEYPRDAPAGGGLHHSGGRRGVHA
ncbi:tyrosinase cofactor [Streptomyces sp. NPDC017890]|uniref:tyrosinase cofactor n=1 Tax=Streptomyces sp. NPDC017890 TaxID=3365015 RepID=UPI0037B132C7